MLFAEAATPPRLGVLLPVQPAKPAVFHLLDLRGAGWRGIGK